MADAELQLLSAYDFDGRNEAEIRGDWIEPLLRRLGYGLGTRNQILREEVLQLKRRMMGSRRIEIDFVPTVHGRRLWIMEAKRPQDDLFSAEHLGQAWSYATDPRVAVPLFALCDGKRIGVFDVTAVDWDSPVVDIPQIELASRFGELVDWIGARKVAERIRVRQLEHLRGALEAQVDLTALTSTVTEVKRIVDEARPAIVERRRSIEAEARERFEAKSRPAIERAGTWHLAASINFNWIGHSRSQIDDYVALVRAQPEHLRQRAFDDIEKVTMRKGETSSRMWFQTRAFRLSCALSLSDDPGCGAHCARSATSFVDNVATGFSDEPVAAAAYRLQRLLGVLGWRVASAVWPEIQAAAKRREETLDPEDWLRENGAWGITAHDDHLRMARDLPVLRLNRLTSWTIDSIEAETRRAEAELATLPPAIDGLMPAGGEMEIWADMKRDPLRDSVRFKLERSISQSPGSTESILAETLLGRLVPPNPQ